MTEHPEPKALKPLHPDPQPLALKPQTLNHPPPRSLSEGAEGDMEKMSLNGESTIGAFQTTDF